MTLDEEINELDTKLMKVGHEKLSMMGPSLASRTTTLEGVVTLLIWPQPHLTKLGSVPYKEERNTLVDIRVFEGCPHPRLVGKLKPRTGDATT